ncbi:MAG: UDP-3-O-(3-hydroxymyristoyl)glucosamine N-acyltransferase [Deltaproteobacteria bacterium]|nr:UDP-3-O-(3-hydroxymyristoyl)glucosamine N-acyltransferase [Deltaproteobacteria bacterium]
MSPLGTLFGLARLHGGEVRGGDRTVVRIAPLGEAGEDDLAPFTHHRYRDALATTRARAILTSPGLAARVTRPEVAVWVHRDPALVLAKVLASQCPPLRPGIHPRAFVHEGARVDPTSRIDAGAVVEDGAVVGAWSVVGPNAVIGAGTTLGARVRVGAGAVVGSDGFGFARGEDGLVRIPHQGSVDVEDDVEIGANATVARATLGRTRIRRGTKIDNLVHVGHNVEVGPDAALAAQVGIAGSSVIGAGVEVGGQAGVADHLVVGDRARLCAKAGVIGDVAQGSTVAGYPAVERFRWLREHATLARIAKKGSE